MRLNLILNRYILKELLPPFIMNMAFFMFVFLMRQVLEITNMIVNYQVGFINFILMLIYSMPYFLVYVIPMSVMMAVLLTFLRLSNDNEIIALKAGGISVYRLIPPVISFSLLCAIITAVLAIWGMPWGESSYKNLAFDVIRSNFNVGLKERQFNNSFQGVMFYVNKIDLRTRSLVDIFIDDHREDQIHSIVVAPKGYLFQGADPYSFILRLYDGMMNQVNLESKSAHSIRFDTYDLQLNFKDAVSGMKKRKKNEYEMSFSELLKSINHAKKKDSRYLSILMEFHKRISIPFACIALAILAIPLGVQTNTSKRSAGLGIGLFAFLIYYLLLSTGYILSEREICPVVIGMWVPNIVMTACGCYLLVKIANDRPVGLFVFIRRVKNSVLQLLGFRLRESV